MKKSYHSMVVPIDEAAATRASEVFFWTGASPGACGVGPQAGEFVAVKTTPVFSVSPSW